MRESLVSIVKGVCADKRRIVGISGVWSRGACDRCVALEAFGTAKLAHDQCRGICL